MKYQLHNDLLFYKGQIHLGTLKPFQQQILQQFHSSPLARHMGAQKTYSRLKKEFYWPGMQEEVRSFIKDCKVCQRNKTETIHPVGLLQPLPIPYQNWTEVSIDFVEGLPPSQGKDVVFVVVDRLSKYAHFISLSHPYTTTSVARLFTNNVFKLHGIPKTIASDRDPTFISQFWKELLRVTGTELLMSSAYHPQTDGQTEVKNKGLEGYLRSFTRDQPRDWVRWLSLAEWAYNNSVHSSTKLTPFEAVYGHPPPRMMPFEHGTMKVKVVEEELKSRDFILKLLQENLQEAQTRVGDWVFLRLRPYRQMSAAFSKNLKLSPRYYGAFQVIQKIGEVAYKLDLPSSSQIYPVFHVSQVKQKLGKQIMPLPHLPAVTSKGTLVPEPQAILERCLKKKGSRAGVEVLVQWKGTLEQDATREDLEDLRASFPDLVDKVL